MRLITCEYITCASYIMLFKLRVHICISCLSEHSLCVHMYACTYVHKNIHISCSSEHCAYIRTYVCTVEPQLSGHLCLSHLPGLFG